MWGYSSSGSLVVELRKASVESETQTEVTFPPQATGVHPIATPQEVVPVSPGPPPLISVQTTLKAPPPTPSPKTIRRTISMGPSTQTLFPASSKFIMVLSLSFLPLTQYPKGDSEEEYEDQPTPGQSTSRVEISPSPEDIPALSEDEASATSPVADDVPQPELSSEEDSPEAEDLPLPEFSSEEEQVRSKPVFSPSPVEEDVSSRWII